MSNYNYLAIATVTATLRDVLQNAVDRDRDGAVRGAKVTTQRPEKAGNGNQSNAGVNLYLYQVTPNAAWRNSDIVIRRPDPQAPDDRGKDKIEQRAQIPLNLHYLLSFYGDEQKLEPQRLLGIAVSAIEAQPKPILSRDAIRAVIQNNSYLYLSQSDLAFQVENIERIKLTPLTLSLEELSKLWSVFFQVPYALSVAYEASVVLIAPEISASVPVVSKLAIKKPDRFMFSVGLDLAGELDKREAPITLRKQFQEHGKPLGPDALVKVDQVGTGWTIVDADDKYFIRREKQTLNVYQDGSAGVAPEVPQP